MKRWRWISPVAFAAAGILFVASARSSGGIDLRTGDHGDLITSIQEQDKRTATMTQQIARLSTSVQNQLMQQVDVSTRTKAITSERLANRAATSAVAGPGVIVTLTDAPTPLGEVPKGFTIDDFVVHQQDVQAVVNALWAGGAEALSINGQRITTLTSIRCAGNTLLLNGRVFSPPFKIAAIGNIGALKISIDTSEAIAIYREYTATVGLGFDLVTRKKISMPAGSLPAQLRVAQPLS